MVYDMKYIWRKGVAWYWGVNLYPMESVLEVDMYTWHVFTEVFEDIFTEDHILE